MIIYFYYYFLLLRNVRIASIPALGKVVEGITDKGLLERIGVQFQSLLDEPESRDNLNLQKVIITTFTAILPNTDAKLRDDFILARSKSIVEFNDEREDPNDRLEIAEELITLYSTALQCFLAKEIISSYIIPALKHLENDIRNVSPETLDSILLLIKEAEEKIDDDKSSNGSGVSSSSKSLFGGISSRFKRKTKDRDRSGTVI